MKLGLFYYPQIVCLFLRRLQNALVTNFTIFKQISDVFCLIGTDTNAFAGFRACKCLDNFFRKHIFEGCTPCNHDGLKCLDDVVSLKSGYWWQWKNKTLYELYRNFTKNLRNPAFAPELHKASNSEFKFPYTIPQPYRCPIAEACKGGLNSSCEVGYEGPLCAVCSDGYYKLLKKCKLCPTKGWMIGQLAIMGAICY